MISLHVERSLLLLLDNKWRLFGQQILKWNGSVSHWCLCNKYNITWPPADKKFLFSCAFTREIFFNTRGEISYLRAAMWYPLFSKWYFWETKSCSNHYAHWQTSVEGREIRPLIFFSWHPNVHLSRISVCCQGHPTSIFGKYLFGRRLDI